MDQSIRKLDEISQKLEEFLQQIEQRNDQQKNLGNFEKFPSIFATLIHRHKKELSEYANRMTIEKYEDKRGPILIKNTLQSEYAREVFLWGVKLLDIVKERIKTRRSNLTKKSAITRNIDESKFFRRIIDQSTDLLKIETQNELLTSENYWRNKFLIKFNLNQLFERDQSEKFLIVSQRRMVDMENEELTLKNELIEMEKLSIEYTRHVADHKDSLCAMEDEIRKTAFRQALSKNGSGDIENQLKNTLTKLGKAEWRRNFLIDSLEISKRKCKKRGIFAEKLKIFCDICESLDDEKNFIQKLIGNKMVEIECIKSEAIPLKIEVLRMKENILLKQESNSLLEKSLEKYQKTLSKNDRQLEKYGILREPKKRVAIKLDKESLDALKSKINLQLANNKTGLSDVVHKLLPEMLGKMITDTVIDRVNNDDQLRRDLGMENAKGKKTSVEVVNFYLDRVEPVAFL